MPRKLFVVKNPSITLNEVGTTGRISPVGYIFGKFEGCKLCHKKEIGINALRERLNKGVSEGFKVSVANALVSVANALVSVANALVSVANGERSEPDERSEFFLS